MLNKDISHYKEILSGTSEKVKRTIGQMKENNDAEQDKYSPAELSNYDNHPAELGTQVFELEHNTALKVHEEHFLKEVQDALVRIEKGTYGKCVFCGNEIDSDRLDVVPYARLCIQCEMEKKEIPKTRKSMRPNEEKVLDAPFGRKYLNKQEDDEHEGMDQLNDLMKYGSSDSPQDMGGYHDYKEFYTNDVDEQGIVDDLDQISNDEYKKQLPD